MLDLNKLNIQCNVKPNNLKLPCLERNNSTSWATQLFCNCKHTVVFEFCKSRRNKVRHGKRNSLCVREIIVVRWHCKRQFTSSHYFTPLLIQFHSQPKLNASVNMFLTSLKRHYRSWSGAQLGIIWRIISKMIRRKKYFRYWRSRTCGE